MMNLENNGHADLFEIVNASDDGSVSRLLASLQAESSDPEKILRQAKTLLAFAQFEAALVALAQLPLGEEVRALRCRCYDHLARWAIEVGDLSCAVWATEQYLREGEGAFQAWALRGEVASLSNDDASALDYFTRALGALPRDYASTPDETRQVNHLLYLRVATLVRLQRYDEALEHWRAVVKRNEENADLWYLGALCLAQLGRRAEALPLCQRALELDAKHIDAARLKRGLEAK